MKIKILIGFFFTLFCVSASAQLNQQSLGGSATTLNTVVGGFWPKLYSIIPKKDTLNNAAVGYVGAITIRPQDTLSSQVPPIYMSNGHYWFRTFGGGTGQGIDSISVSIDSLFYLAWNGGNQIFTFSTLQKTVIGDYPIQISRTAADTLHIKCLTCDGSFTNGLITGGLVSYSGTGLVYDVTTATYIINGVQYNSSSGNITLTASDPTFDRIDVIALDTAGHIVVITGEAGANPVVPQIDPVTQVLLTSIIVKAGSTVPVGVQVTVVYDENLGTPTEFNASVQSGFTVNFNSTTNPYHLIKTADAGTWTTVKNITFTSGVVRNKTDYTLLKMFINLKANLNATSNIQVYFMSGTTILNVTPVTLGTGQGFSKTGAGYQNVTIDLATLNFTSNSFDKIVVRTRGAGAGFLLDYVQLQGGIVNGNSPYITDVLRSNDSVYVIKNGVKLFAYIDSTGTSGAGWSLTGNAGTNPSVNFLGTTDAQPLRLRVNNLQAGQISSVVGENMYIGKNSMFSNTTGNFNTAYGEEALFDNTTGTANTALGSYALWKNTTGKYNEAVGNGALGHNLTGSYNIGIGINGLANILTGDHNIGIGAGSGMLSTDYNKSILIGDSTDLFADGDTNEIVHGYKVKGHGSNTITFGNDNNDSTFLGGYGSGTVNGTMAYALGVDARGKVMEYTPSGGGGTGLANFYLKDSVFSSDRVGDLSGHSLQFINGRRFDVAADTFNIGTNFLVDPFVTTIAPTDNMSHIFLGAGGYLNIDADVGMEITTPSLNLNGYIFPPAGVVSNGQVLTTDAFGVTSWQTPSSGGVTSVSGTTNRITSTGGTTPVLDISSTFEGLLLKKSDSATIYQTKYGTDSARNNIYPAIAGKENALTIGFGLNRTGSTLKLDSASLGVLSRQRAAATYAPISINGTVTSVSRTNGLGILASVATSTTTPNITISVDTSDASILSRQRAAATYLLQSDTTGRWILNQTGAQPSSNFNITGNGVIGNNFSVSGMNTFSGNSGISAPSVYISGAVGTGGTGTTNLPHFFIQDAATTPSTTWSVNGTLFGMNALTGYAGNLFDFKLNGASRANMTAAGTLILTTGGMTMSAGSLIISAGSETISAGNLTVTAGTTTLGGSTAFKYRAITALRTLDATDYTIDCTANSFTVTLPTAASISGRVYIIKNSGAGSISVATTSAQTIDGSATFTLGSQYKYVTIQSNGVNWIVISNN